MSDIKDSVNGAAAISRLKLFQLHLAPFDIFGSRAGLLLSRHHGFADTREALEHDARLVFGDFSTAVRKASKR